MGPEAPALSRRFRRDLGKPDDRLDCLDLTEKWPLVLELVAAPVAEESRRFRRHLPLALRQLPPALDGGADTVDHLSRIVFLLEAKIVALGIEISLRLTPRLLGFRDRRDERASATH